MFDLENAKRIGLYTVIDHSECDHFKLTFQLAPFKEPAQTISSILTVIDPSTNEPHIIQYMVGSLLTTTLAAANKKVDSYLLSNPRNKNEKS